MVNEPTRKGNLLDVVLTDLVDETETKVLPSITDQNLVLVEQSLSAPDAKTIERQVWSFREADWEGLRQNFLYKN